MKSSLIPILDVKGKVHVPSKSKHMKLKMIKHMKHKQ